MKFIKSVISVAFILFGFNAGAQEINIDSVMSMHDDSNKVNALSTSAKGLAKSLNYDSATYINFISKQEMKHGLYLH
jgi:hypothetical protein